jgi:hypothetical protein
MKRVCVATLMVALISVSISFIASAQYLDSTEWRFVDLLNSYRMQNGLRPVITGNWAQQKILQPDTEMLSARSWVG